MTTLSVDSLRSVECISFSDDSIYAYIPQCRLRGYMGWSICRLRGYGLEDMARSICRLGGYGLEDMGWSICRLGGYGLEDMARRICRLGGYGLEDMARRIWAGVYYVNCKFSYNISKCSCCNFLHNGNKMEAKEWLITKKIAF